MNILRIATPNRTWYEIILWWELRRIPYNVIMYFAGLASFYIGYVTLPLLYIIIGVLLNVGYCLGWSAELLVVSQLDETKKMKYAPIAFYCYLALSILAVLAFACYLYFSR